MELLTVAHGESVRPSLLGRGAGVHEDILKGTDAEISWEDIYAGKCWTCRVIVTYELDDGMLFSIVKRISC